MGKIGDSGAYTLDEWGQLNGGVEGEVIELLTEDNSILDDIPWIQSNKDEGHQTEIRTKLGEPEFGALYRGAKKSKGETQMVTDVTGFIDDRNEIDVRLLELNGNKRKYRIREAKAHLEGLRNKTAENFFYGSRAVNPLAFDGLNVRYPYANGPGVVDAGGTGTKLTDMWLVVWGDSDVHGIFPKGTKAGIGFDNVPKEAAKDSLGNTYYVSADNYIWHQGLTVRDWRSVSRICNIDTTKLLLPPSDADYVNIHDMIILAEANIPESKIGRAVWYGNRDIQTALKIQANKKENVDITREEWMNAKNVVHINSIPLRRCDAILSTQSVLPDL